MKKTSATGFMRHVLSANKRVEDGTKLKMLCKECEGIFSKYETEFAKNIFHPYVNKELSLEGFAQGIIKEIPYNSWLLKFIISVHWRMSMENSWGTLEPKLQQKIDEFKIVARDFLIGERKDSGINESHLIFLQNLAYANGDFPDNINESINRYLLRAIDGTSYYTKKSVGIFSKLGPIALVTTLIPAKLKNTNDSKVHFKGSISTKQIARNTDINQFIFINRPNEVMKLFNISDKQMDIIKETAIKNPAKTLSSLSYQASLGDQILKNKLDTK